MSSTLPAQRCDVLLLRRAVQGPSLVSQLARGWREGGLRLAACAAHVYTSIPRRSLRVAAALILTVPLTSTIGAQVLAWSAQAEGDAVADAAAAREWAGRRTDMVVATRGELRRALGRPPIGQTVATLAAALPAGAVLHRLSRDEAGALTVVVDAPDPDMLRAAFGGSPALSTLREIGQEGSGTGGLLVTLRSFDL